MAKYRFKFDGKTVDWLMLAGVVVVLVLSVLIFLKVNKESYRPGEENPGGCSTPGSYCEYNGKDGICVRDRFRGGTVCLTDMGSCSGQAGFQSDKPFMNNGVPLFDGATCQQLCEDGKLGESVGEC